MASPLLATHLRDVILRSSDLGPVLPLVILETLGPLPWIPLSLLGELALVTGFRVLEQLCGPMDALVHVKPAFLEVHCGVWAPGGGMILNTII
jgi:hypothetical protein